jgi:uncharacterized protein (DUF169 family)
MTEFAGNKDYSNAARILVESLDLHQAPVAISFAETIPEGVTEYAGRVPAGCKFWEEAAGSVFATSAANHSLCAIGVYTHNLQPSPSQQTDLMDALRIFGDLGYVTEQDLPLIPVLKSQPNYVIYAPLAETPVAPDIVLLFVSANQTLILSEATQQVENQNPPAMGRPACAVVPQVMNTGRAALSSGCCGARAYLDTLTDSVAIFAIPAAKLENYVRRIEALAKANAVLAKFHELRRRDVEAGRTPTIKDSMAALQAANR